MHVRIISFHVFCFSETEIQEPDDAGTGGTHAGLANNKKWKMHFLWSDYEREIYVL